MGANGSLLALVVLAVSATGTTNGYSQTAERQCAGIAGHYQANGLEQDLVANTKRPVSMADRVGKRIEGAVSFDIQLNSDQSAYSIRLFAAGGGVLHTTDEARGFACVEGRLVRQRSVTATGDGRPAEVKQTLLLYREAGLFHYEVARVTTSKGPFDAGAVSRVHLITTFEPVN